MPECGDGPSKKRFGSLVQCTNGGQQRSFFDKRFFGSFFWRLQKMNKKPSQKHKLLETVIILKNKEQKVYGFEP